MHRTPTEAPAVARALWSGAGLPLAALERLHLVGAEPALPSSFPIATALQAGLGAAALAAAELGAARGGVVQEVTVDARDVVREAACRFTLDGHKPDLWDPLSGLYRCAGHGDEGGAHDAAQVGGPAGEGAGGGWVRVHANFAHHRDGVLQLLGLPAGAATPRGEVEAALLGWKALDFEAAAGERGLVVAAVRSPAQWQRHPQAAALAARPLVSIERIGDAPPLHRALPGAASMPLAGLRVLDLTRILAGPVATRTLAAYGADVLLVNGPHLPNIAALAETSRGKLSTCLDLRREDDTERLRALARETDVFVQGYRPGGLASRGFGPQALAQLRPGIVCVSLSAYGPTGPWAARRGFDSLVQSATGLNVDEAAAFGESTPRALPLQALDYGAGFLLAFGALAALHRQRREGGSWHVQVALAGVGRWLAGLGRLPEGPRARAPSFDDVMEESDSGFGRLAAVRHAARLSMTPARWQRPAMPPGTHPAQWPAQPEASSSLSR